MQSKPSKGRPRSLSAEAAILQATLKLLDSNEIRDVSYEAIAKLAGVGKATLYRWWPTKSFLILDAISSRVQAAQPIPDTGSALNDFKINLKALTALYKAPDTGPLLVQLWGECLLNKSFRQVFRDRFFDLRRGALKIIWERGVSRGEIRADVDSELFMDLIYGPLIMRLMMDHAPLDDVEAERTVSVAFQGLGERSQS
jgi:AcrR family transcriptional regulator